MKPAWREAQVCVDKGKTRKEALDAALIWMNTKLIWKIFISVFCSMTASFLAALV